MDDLTSEDISTEIFDLYCVNLRAWRDGDNYYLNYRRIKCGKKVGGHIEEDENLQAIVDKNQEMLEFQICTFQDRINQIAHDLNWLDHSTSISITEQEQAVIENQLYEQAVELRNHMKSQASLPIFKFVLASKNMMDYLVDKNQGLIKTQIQFFF